MAKLYYFHGTMNAGKTNHLLSSAHNYRERKMEVLLMKPSIDNRCDIDFITSRTGLKKEALIISNNNNLYEITKNTTKIKNIRCVLIDEINFLTEEHIFQLSEIVDQLGIPVLAYGLKTNFKGRLFDSSKRLLELADEIIEIKTICGCGKASKMIIRIDKNGFALTSGKNILVGGEDIYVSLCRKCWKKAFYNGKKIIQ